jgi:hypothetical protein
MELRFLATTDLTLAESVPDVGGIKNTRELTRHAPDWLRSARLRVMPTLGCQEQVREQS